MKLLVVIANYKVAHLTIDCLRSMVEEVGRVPGTHVAVCENGTGDDSAERIQKAITDNRWGSWCTLTAVYPNRGFTGGNNVILRPALQSADPPEYALLLNADTVVRPGTFKALVDFMDRHPRCGVAGSGLENPDGSPQRSTFRFWSAMSQFEASIRWGLITRLLRRWVITSFPVPEHAAEVDWVSGASFIIRREVFNDIGVLDDGYYTHFEDIDFCFNARKAGWEVWYVPESRVMHFAGQSTGITVKNPKRLPPYYFETRRRYFLKNYGPLYTAFADAAMILGLTIWQFRVFFGKPDFSPPHFSTDSIRHSVFLTGFKLRNVENPALRAKNGSSSELRQASS